MFAPVYPPLDSQQTFLARKQKRRQRKRRHETDADGDDSESGTVRVKQHSSSDEEDEEDVRTHSVSRTDPYHVAGYSREAPLPPLPFPHAGVKIDETQTPLEEELAQLKPPILTAKQASQSSSLKRRHIDNLTTILHTCMLKGDWTRAARAWALLLRTEVFGQPMDVREHGRWAIGAELLMRTKDDDGFRLARDYYERLILQYPHNPRGKHPVNALTFYPALFDVWIYEVQDRYRRRRQESHSRRHSNSSNVEDEDVSMASASSDSSVTRALRQQELDDVLPIAARMDDLLLSPPYDTSLPLLRTRGMVGLWLADLYSVVGEAHDTEAGEDGIVQSSQTVRRAKAQKQKALTNFHRVHELRGEMPRYVLNMLESGDEEMQET